MKKSDCFKQKILKWANISYSSDNKFHNAVFILIVTLLIFACFPVQKAKCETVLYPCDDISYHSQYIKQFDAFYKGQLHLDLEVDPKLAELENPYNTAERDASGAFYHFDHAYYDGKYYSYFGIAPVFIVYYPFYIVHGSLPNNAFACLILAVYAVIFMSLAFKEIIRRFCEKPNIYLYMLGFIAVVSATGIYMGVFCSDVYYIAVLSALACAAAFVFFAFRAARETKVAKRAVFLVLCCLCLVLTVCSRPTMALACAAAFPILAELLWKIRKETVSSKIISVSAFAFPLVAGAAAVMWFNFARFGSPFDFGANYQLTVNDISENTIEFSFLFSAFFSFFLCPLFFTKKFPFGEMQLKLVLPDEARYVYSDIYVGAFAYGIPCGILLYPFVAALDRRAGKKDATKDVFVFLTFVICFIVAFADFCLAGVNMRYIYDITPIHALAGAFTLLSLQEKTHARHKAVTTVLAILLFVSAIYTNICAVYTIATR